MDEDDSDDEDGMEVAEEGQAEETVVAECESTSVNEADEKEDSCEIADEIEETVRHAAGKQRITRIRLEIGRKLSVSKVKLAGILHKRFPDASIDMKESRNADSVVVKDIEVAD